MTTKEFGWHMENIAAWSYAWGYCGESKKNFGIYAAQLFPEDDDPRPGDHTLLVGVAGMSYIAGREARANRKA